MASNLYEIYSDVEKAIDLAFDGHFVLKFYDYLKIKDAKRDEVKEFIQSSTSKEISNLINDLELYLQGGQDNLHIQLREAYGHISKPTARKIKNYLANIIDDACRYNYDKRPGRRKKQSK